MNMHHKQVSDIATESDEWRPQPHHKDTVHWCKGHVGRTHVPTIVRASGPYRAECGMKQSYKEPGHDVWHCSHVVKCEGCGKVLEALPTDDCPDRG